MTGRTTETSPQTYARLAGWLYLILAMAGIFAGFVRTSVIVPDDAAATANNIVMFESIYRFGVVVELVSLTCAIAVTLLFYELFKPVHTNLSLLALFFSLMGSACTAVICISSIAPLALFAGGQYLTAFKVEQVQALALMSLKLPSQAPVHIVFYGLYWVLIGYLVFKSTFLPRVFGALAGIGGLVLLTGSSVNILSPDLAQRLPLSAMVVMSGAIGPGSLCAWLIMVGVNVPKWKETVTLPDARPQVASERLALGGFNLKCNFEN